MEAVLLHESQHRRRYDPLRCWLVELVLSSLFWRPASSLARYYRASREAAADRAAVLAQGDDRPLLRALAKADSLRAMPGTCGLSSDRQSVMQEIRHMHSPLVPADGLHVGIGLAVVAGLLILVTIGLTDWQWFWFCPDAASMG